MKLKFICTRWGSEHIPWPQFVQQVKEAGYEGIETPLPKDGVAEIVRLLKENDLLFIIQHYHTSLLNTPEEQYNAFEVYLWKAVEYQPLFINSQTGKDYFTISENESLFAITTSVQKQSGIKILHETHRGKWSFAAHITKQYIERFPQLRLTLDISHWCNVAESYLENQVAAVDLDLSRTDYIHARVGYTQSAQVPDPRAPMWQDAVEKHCAWWDKIIALHNSDETFCICPEFGAPPYAHLYPYTGEPVASQWEMNL